MLIGVSLSLLTLRADQPSSELSGEQVPAATSIIEARSRARLLHETIRGTLQVVHRDFFDEVNAHAIPSASLEDVFDELADSYDIDLKWLIVETDMVNVDHQPEDEFENAAVKALKQGKPESSEHLAELIKSARDGKGAVTVRLLREGSQIELEIPLYNR